jgi:Tol biopolymer transport system component
MVAINTTSLVRIAVADSGAPGNQGTFALSISPGGRFVTFDSYSSNLVAGDANNQYDVFLRDTLLGTTRLVSMAPDGAFGNGGGDTGGVSDDGRFVVFSSASTNLVAGDTNGYPDVFVRDMQSGATTRVSQATDGTGGTGFSFHSSITGDGRFVMFESYATNLVGGDTNGVYDVFRRDILTGGMQRVSVGMLGKQGDGSSSDAQMSGDGRFIVFTSVATNLVASDKNGHSDVFLRDTVAKTTVRVSVGNKGAEGNDASNRAQVSGDGRFVVFTSSATNLVTGDTNGATDIFLRDRAAGTTKLVSAGLGGASADNKSYEADISADGRFVVFTSDASNLVAGDTNGARDVFLRDMAAGTTTRLSVGLGGMQGNSGSYAPSITPDGQSVTFKSYATNFAAGTTLSDFFRVSLFASGAADYLIGSDAADAINALGGTDIVKAGGGNDTLDGGAGADSLIGGSGSDTASYGSAKTGVTVNLQKASLNTGDAKGDTYSSVENLLGGTHGDKLTGTSGANRLDGGDGADTLTGGKGDDSFVFATKLGSKNIDTITDFGKKSGDHDGIYLDASLFKALGKNVTSNEFLKVASGHAAKDSTDHLIYNTKDGSLWYDADGSGKGAAVHFATLSNHAALAYEDFFIV